MAEGQQEMVVLVKQRKCRTRGYVSDVSEIENYIATCFPPNPDESEELRFNGWMTIAQARRTFLLPVGTNTRGEGGLVKALEDAVELFELSDACNDPGSDAFVWLHTTRLLLDERKAKPPAAKAAAGAV